VLLHEDSLKAGIKYQSKRWRIKLEGVLASVAVDMTAW
jgi:hypothetical protein